MRTQPQEIITKLEADNSRLAKEAVIQEAMEQGLDEFFEGVPCVLDPCNFWSKTSTRSNSRRTRAKLESIPRLSKQTYCS